MLQKTVYTAIKPSLLTFTLLTSAEITNSAPSYSAPSHTTLIPASMLATIPGQEIRPLVPPQKVDAPPQPTSPSAIAVAQAGDVSPTVTLSASPTSIPKGQSSKLAWTSANATACRGTGKDFSPSGVSGSVAVAPGDTATYDVTCTGAGGSAHQSVTLAVTAAPTLAIGTTVKATGTIYLSPAPKRGAPVIGSEAPGNRGVIIGGPASDSYTWWKVAFDDDLTGWIYQSGVTAASPTAPTLRFSANPGYIAPGARRPASLGQNRSPSRSTPPGSFDLAAQRVAPWSSWTEVCMWGSAIGKIRNLRIPRLPAPKSYGSILQPAAGSKTKTSIRRCPGRPGPPTRTMTRFHSRDGPFRPQLQQRSDYAGRRSHGRFLEYEQRTGHIRKNRQDRLCRSAGAVDALRPTRILSPT
jgi:hypothetical protein